MKTELVKKLVVEVLDTLSPPFSEHIIDEVFAAIEQNSKWRSEYDSACDELSLAVVNTWGGYWIANTLGKSGEKQVSSKRSKLIGSYSLLDADAKVIVRRPKHEEALQLMASFYQANKLALPADIKKHRELIIELIMNGLPPQEAFDMVSTSTN